MGVFSKLKGIFYDEVVVDEPEEELEKVDKIVKQPVVDRSKDEEPKVEKVKFQVFEDIDEEPIKEEKKETKTDNTFSERELFRSERTFNFTEFDDEEELPPRKNVLDKEVRTTNNLDIKQSIPEHRVFKPTPIISPIYGILDKDYKKEEIKSKNENSSSDVMSIKVTNYDTVRRKAYGTLEDELEDTLNSINKLSTETINKEVNNIEKDVSRLSKTAKIEELINKIDDVSEELDKTMSIGELEDNTPLDNFEDESEFEDDEDLSDKTMTDSTLEHDLFNLIDSMYDDK